MDEPAAGGSGRRHEPILNAPAVVSAVLGLLVAIHLIRLVLPEDVDWHLVISLGVIPARYFGGAEVPVSWLSGYWALLLPLLGYSLLHGGVVHLALNGVWLLAIGSPVARRLGALRFLLFYAVTAILAAAIYVLIRSDSDVPVIGASGAISGLFGAIARVFTAGRDGFSKGGAPATDRRVLGFAVVWLIVNAVMGLSATAADAAPVAWEAHAGGFLAGLLLFPLFDPGLGRRTGRP